MPLPPNTKKKNAPPLPPVAVPVEITLQPGEKAEIPLRVYSPRGQTIRYLLRSRPSLGKVVALGPSDNPSVWVLTYQHTSPMTEGGDLSDRILFAAQDSDGTSAPAEIAITIADAPPEMVAPAYIDFGKIPAGLPALRTFTLANRGGHVLEGEIGVEGVWTVEPTGYRLPRASKEEFRIAFRPDREGEFRGALRIPGLEEPVPVRADVFAPFEAEPALLELEENEKNLTRSGHLTLRNRTAVDQTLTITAPQRLKLPETITLGPNESREIPLTLGEDDPDALEASLKVEGSGVTRTVTLKAPESGPRLRANRETVAFGNIATGRAHRQKITVENWGGKPADLIAYVPEPFEATPREKPLAPGEKVEITLSVSPAWEGPLNALLKIQGGPLHLDIPITAEAVSPAPAPPLPAYTSKSEATPQEEADPKAAVPTLEPLTLLRKTGTGVEIAWPRVKEAQPGEMSPPVYRMEVRAFKLDGSGKARVSWEPYAAARLTEKGEQMVATIPEVPEGATIVLRAATLDPAGKTARVSPPFFFSVPPPKVYFTTQRLVLAGFVLLLGVGLWLRSGRSLFGVRLHR